MADGKYGNTLAVAARSAGASEKKDSERPSKRADDDDDKDTDAPEGLEAALDRLFEAKDGKARVKAFKAAHRICSSYED